MRRGQAQCWVTLAFLFLFRRKHWGLRELDIRWSLKQISVPKSPSKPTCLDIMTYSFLNTLFSLQILEGFTMLESVEAVLSRD